MARQAGKGVLFLGTENLGRSRVAEILFNAVAAKMGLAWVATSRGVATKPMTKKDVLIAATALKALQAGGVRGGDFSRQPVQATDADLESAEIVIALNRAEHEPLVRERFTAWAEKVQYWQVPADADPLPAVEREVGNLVARLLGGRASEEVAETVPKGQVPKPTTVRVGRETKGRKGKGVTTVSDLPLDDEALRELATLLKGRCGTGGTVKDGRIEIQGDQRDRLTAELEKLGYRVKRAGG